MKIIKLYFESPVHFGEKRLSESKITFSADTLFSALMIEAVGLGKEDEFYQLASNNLVKFSDAFPFIDQYYYIPKPMFNLKLEKEDENLSKAFKKLIYVPIDSLEDYLSGGLDAYFERESFNLGKLALSEKVQQHDFKDSEPYNVGTFTFKENTGLYVLIEQTHPLLEELLENLQYSGIGGKRNSGYGKFKFEILEDSDIEDLFSAKGNRKILLSGALPKDAELEQALKKASYLLERRGGFVQSDTYATNLVKKQDLYVFKNGSTFENSFDGDIYQVGKKGNHPVYKYAKSFFLEVSV
ncbi:type III-A CRISPR-associated RAMP protein Csm4 [Lactococcus raffinolactis]|uniref:type III-A CRISPR-associated RAMP protein Csm4 n=1 Tax=Pseudolactococcus raffinolactis TaxID=1366 RepID=UPI0011086911|nr:type III-A CRISPR-associated RAMP protein Csm4 [Lactococcus raffinolactis]TLQ11939.1 type III-A CRISPR-associated RAMP protein Csm4 [Lactococcus raffinolactis]